MKNIKSPSIRKSGKSSSIRKSGKSSSIRKSGKSSSIRKSGKSSSIRKSDKSSSIRKSGKSSSIRKSGKSSSIRKSGKSGKFGKFGKLYNISRKTKKTTNSLNSPNKQNHETNSSTKSSTPPNKQNHTSHTTKKPVKSLKSLNDQNKKIYKNPIVHDLYKSVYIGTFTSAFNNFGDVVGYEFYKFLSQQPIKNVSLRKNIKSYICVGSILEHIKSNHTAMGVGFIKKHETINIRPEKILSVRGPLTRDILLKNNIKCPEKYGDPLILFPLYYNPSCKNQYDIGVIPHYIDYNNSNTDHLINHLSKKYSVKKINIRTGNNYKPFIEQIKASNYIISSSLHGVIMGIVYAKKTIYVRVSNKVIGGDFKFNDFFQSLDIQYPCNVYNKNNIEDADAYIDDLLKKPIPVDKNNLYKIGVDIITVCPFINKARKNQLIEYWCSYTKRNFE